MAQQSEQEREERIARELELAQKKNPRVNLVLDTTRSDAEWLRTVRKRRKQGR